jgi:filamentous hemagglutinin
MASEAAKAEAATSSPSVDTPAPAPAAAGGAEALAAGDVANRPGGFRKGTVQGAWDSAAEGPTSGRLCPTCSKEVKVPPGKGTREQPRDWDVDHQPPWSTRDQTGRTRKEVLDDYNTGTRLECPTCNRRRGARPAE